MNGGKLQIYTKCFFLSSENGWWIVWLKIVLNGLWTSHPGTLPDAKSPGSLRSPECFFFFGSELIYQDKTQGKNTFFSMLKLYIRLFHALEWGPKFCVKKKWGFVKFMYNPKMWSSFWRWLLKSTKILFFLFVLRFSVYTSETGSTCSIFPEKNIEGGNYYERGFVGSLI